MKPRVNTNAQRAEGVTLRRDSKQIHVPRTMHLALRLAAAMHSRTTGESVTLAALVERMWLRVESEAGRRGLAAEELLLEMVSDGESEAGDQPAE